jgi:hypothetical protein
MAELKTNPELKPQQWQFADEVSRDLRSYVEMLAEDHPHDDPFTEQLSKWCVALGVLSWEILAGTIELTRSKKRYAAFVLSRSLIDYALRLRYYRLNAEPLATEWRTTRDAATGTSKAARTQAAIDWSDTHEKLIASLKEHRFDLNDFEEADTAQLFGLLERQSGARGETLRKMLEVYDEDKQVRDECFIEWSLRDAYLSGDQTAVQAILGSSDPRTALEGDSAMDDLNIVLTAIWFSLEIMYEFREITGRNYAINVLGRKFFDVFEIDD